MPISVFIQIWKGIPAVCVVYFRTNSPLPVLWMETLNRRFVYRSFSYCIYAICINEDKHCHINILNEYEKSTQLSVCRHVPVVAHPSQLSIKEGEIIRPGMHMKTITECDIGHFVKIAICTYILTYWHSMSVFKYAFSCKSRYMISQLSEKTQYID